MGFSPEFMNRKYVEDTKPVEKKVPKQKEKNRMLIPYGDDDPIKKPESSEPPKKLKSWKLLFGIIVIAAILYELYWLLEPLIF